MYADTDLLDLVSCFMNKNLDAGKIHKDQRDTFVTAFQNYNWESDPLKLKGIKDAAQVLPESSYV